MVPILFLFSRLLSSAFSASLRGDFDSSIVSVAVVVQIRVEFERNEVVPFAKESLRREERRGRGESTSKSALAPLLLPQLAQALFEPPTVSFHCLLSWSISL